MAVLLDKNSYQACTYENTPPPYTDGLLVFGLGCQTLGSPAHPGILSMSNFTAELKAVGLVYVGNPLSWPIVGLCLSQTDEL